MEDALEIMMLYGYSEEESKSVLHYSYRNQPIMLHRRTNLDCILRRSIMKRAMSIQLCQSIEGWLTSMFDLIMLVYFQQIEGYFKSLNQKLDACQSNERFPVDVWRKEINNVKTAIKGILYKRLSKGEQTLDSNFICFLENEIQNLQPLSECEYHLDANDTTQLHSSFQLLQQQMEQMFKSNNRVTFKMMQELIEKVESLGAVVSDDQQENVEELMKRQEVKLFEMQQVAIEIFDMFDLVYQSALQSNDTAWSDELERAINKILALLQRHGIHELPVLGELIDGTKMEVIGRVSKEKLPDGYKPYEVYAVHQRAFMDQHSGQLIRKAKVTTVY